MKKILFLASFLSIATISTMMAQNAAGARVGATWNNVTSKDLNGTVDFKNMSSMSAGAFYEVGLGYNFYVQPELNYNEKGFRSDVNKDLTLFGINLPVGGSAVSVIKYVDVPVLLKYKLGNTEGGVKAYIMAGPSLGYALSGNIETRAKVLIDIKVADSPINLNSNNYKRTELAGVIGAGVELPIGDRAKFFVDARFAKSLTDVYELPVVGSRLRNQSFGLGVGFALNLY